MNLYFVRHGDAEKSAIGKKDFDRALTSEGKDKVKKITEHWKHFVSHIDYIVSSPLVRALQTAEIIADTLQCKECLVVDKALGTGSNLKDIITLVTSMDVENIILVGHQPDFSYHIGDLIADKGANVEFKKTAIAKISFEGKVKPGTGVLEFLIPGSTFI